MTKGERGIVHLKKVFEIEMFLENESEALYLIIIRTDAKPGRPLVIQEEKLRTFENKISR